MQAQGNSQHKDAHEGQHISAMVQTPGPILRFFGKRFFGAIAFDEKDRKRIIDAYTEGVPVFVQNSKSLLDYLYLNYAFLRWGIPLVQFALGMSLILFRPLKAVIGYIFRSLFGRRNEEKPENEILTDTLRQKKPVLVWLRRPQSLIQWGVEEKPKHLETLIRAQADCSFPLILLPITIIWDQTPESYDRTIFDVIFGDPQAPSAIRKLISFVRNFTKARVQTARPINLQAFLQENRDTEDIEVRAARLRYELSREFLLEAKAVRGPLLKGAKRIVDEILRTPDFQDDLLEATKASGVDKETAAGLARQYLLKIAADFRFNWTEWLGVVAAFLFHRFFRGISVDQKGLQVLRDASRKAPIVLIPAHRSHIDYLMISWVIYTHGLVPPHIAAGENLSFWPVGPIFRHSGAFFIRRTVKGDEIYKVVLAHYLRKLLKEGYCVEFFIEGTRSRTGKSLTPKIGMLKMVVDAVVSGAAPDAIFLPLAVTYEKVVEEKAYHQESSGAEKKRESVLALAKGAKALTARYGKCYLRFESPISLVSYLKSQGIEWKSDQQVQASPEVLTRLAHFLVHRFNSCFVVTLHQVVAFALLAHPKRGIDFETLLRRVGFLILYLYVRDALLSDIILEPLTSLGLLAGIEKRARLVPWDEENADRMDAIGFALKSRVEDVIKLFYKEEKVTLQEYAEDIVISVRPESRLALDYYKNGLIHFFSAQAILARTLLWVCKEDGDRSLDRVSMRSKSLSRVFKFEFIFSPEEPFDAIFARTLKEFESEKVIEVRDGTVKILEGGEEVVRFFAGIIAPFIEGYMVLARVVQEVGDKASKKETLRSAVQRGRKMFLVGELDYLEAVNTIVFSNCYQCLEDEVSSGRHKDLQSAAKGMLEVLSP
jgi:glycerol-3-phosphate O-acyltransferase